MVPRTSPLKLTWLLLLVAALLSACGRPAAPLTPTAPAGAPGVPTTTTEVSPPAPAETSPIETQAAATGRLILATTTSTEDSGLLDALLPDFEAQSGLDVQVVAVGSGQAMEMGQNGDADVLLVHSPKAEEQFVADGYGVDRAAVMHNDFVIVGPEADPAGIRGMTDAAAAMAKIAGAEAIFVSRGDDSGTHSKERSLWAKAGITPTGASWYVSAGQGMGAVLGMAEEMSGYTLSDRGTYLARTAEGYSLPILVEGDFALYNPYHVIAVNPEKYPDANYEGAKAFIAWITAPETQAEIAAFAEPKSGKPLFYPDAQPADAAPAAALKVTGQVEQELAWAESEVRALPAAEIQAPDRKGEMQTYNGVKIADLLAEAKVKAEATGIVFVADDGYTAEVTLAELQSCADCLLAFRDDGGFSTVMPGFPNNLQVKGVVEIRVK